MLCAMTDADIVQRFLLALQDRDLDAAMALLHEDAVWINVSLPTVRGRKRIDRFCRMTMNAGGGFRVHFYAVADDGAGVVLTDRCDALSLGRFEQRFWVYGRFEVRDGR